MLCIPAIVCCVLNTADFKGYIDFLRRQQFSMCVDVHRTETIVWSRLSQKRYNLNDLWAALCGVEKCNEYPHYDGKATKAKIGLGHNFRSRKGILDCVNFMFSRLMTPSCGDIEYNEDERLNFPSVKTASDTVDAEFLVIETDEEKASLAEASYIASEIAEEGNRRRNQEGTRSHHHDAFHAFHLLYRG